MKNNPGERVQQFRNKIGLSQGTFSKEIGMSQPNVSKIESGQLEASNTFLFAMMALYAANPEWIKTGQGEMLISTKEYLSKGIKLLGSQKIYEGLKEVLSDPQFSELQSLVFIDEMIKDNLNEDLKAYIRYILNQNSQGNERIRTWLMVQLEKAFPEVIKNNS